MERIISNFFNHFKIELDLWLLYLYEEMEFPVPTRKILDATVWLSKSKSPLPFDLWHKVVSFAVENPKLKDYIIINEQVIHVKKSISRTEMRSMTPLRLFKKKSLLPKMHRKTFGSKLQDSFIAFDLLEGRKTIEEVLAL